MKKTMFRILMLSLVGFTSPVFAASGNLKCFDQKPPRFMVLNSNTNITRDGSGGKEVHYFGSDGTSYTTDVTITAMDGSIVQGTHCYSVCISVGMSWEMLITLAKRVDDRNCQP